MDYLTLSFIMLLGQFSPGPDMLLLLRNSLAHPQRAGIFTVLGITAGLCIHSALALAGVAAAVKNSQIANAMLLLAGGLWLAWLAVKLLLSLRREEQAVEEEAAAARPHGRRPLSDKAAFLQGFLTNLTNPKAIIFLASVLISWIGPDPSLWRKAGFFIIIVGQALVFWSLFVWLLQRPRAERFYLRMERRINAVFGIALLAIALRALWSGGRML